MPNRAPSYYHWAQDKPCTTNQNYGFAIKPDMLRRQAEDSLKPKKPEGPFDYTRPFSNLGFFPEIAVDKSLTTRRSKTAHVGMSKSRDVPSINKFDINRGYTMGHIPITNRLLKPQLPADVRLVRHKSVPSTYDFPVSKHPSLYLWHTLSGCLVHVKNHVPEAQPDPYKRTKAEVQSVAAC